MQEPSYRYKFRHSSSLALICEHEETDEVFHVGAAAVCGAELWFIEEFFGEGGKLELRPNFSGKIYSITWKHNNNLVAEWVEKINDLQYYDTFDG